MKTPQASSKSHTTPKLDLVLKTFVASGDRIAIAWMEIIVFPYLSDWLVRTSGKIGLSAVKMTRSLFHSLGLQLNLKKSSLYRG